MEADRVRMGYFLPLPGDLLSQKSCLRRTPMKLNWTMAISGFIGCILTLLLLSPAHCQQSMLGPWQIDIKGNRTAGLKYDFVNWTLKYQDIFYATTEEQYYNTTVYYDENNPSYSIMVMWDSRGHDTVILDMSFYDPYWVLLRLLFRWCKRYHGRARLGYCLCGNVLS